MRWDGPPNRSPAPGSSPGQALTLTLEAGQPIISHESIYRFVYHRSAQKDYWHRLLPRRKSRRGRLHRGGRSAVDFIKDRSAPGHWEADYMLFARYGQALLVAHERTTRFTLLDHPSDRKAARTTDHLTALLTPIHPRLRQTLTFDNGPEFAQHHRLADHLGLQTFFCDSRSPWQKGGVENAIGRLRRTLPRKTNLEETQPQTLARAIEAYNHTPRKCLDFLTPAEAFQNLQSTVALQT